MKRSEELAIFPSDRMKENNNQLPDQPARPDTVRSRTQTRNSRGEPLQNSPPSICLVHRCWQLLVYRRYVPVRWPHHSSPSRDLGVHWRKLFLLRLCPRLLLVGCWPLFSWFWWPSSPRRDRWLDLAVRFVMRRLQPVHADALLSFSALYDVVKGREVFIYQV